MTAAHRQTGPGTVTSSSTTGRYASASTSAFTDFILYDGVSNDVQLHKLLTTPGLSVAALRVDGNHRGRWASALLISRVWCTWHDARDQCMIGARRQLGLL